VRTTVCTLLALAAISSPFAAAQGMGSAGSISGTVADPSGALIPGVAVELQNRISGYDKTVTTDGSGVYHFLDLPPNNYHLTAKAPGFSGYAADVAVRGSVPVTQPIVMAIGTESTSIEVSAAADLIESAPTPHTEVDTSQFENLPTYSVAGGLNDVVAHSAPGVIEDSNGFIHPQGDHAETQFVFDNQPVTDQQNKNFSTSMPENAIASVEVIAGAPPAEYGDKTSLVINAITKSGLGVTKSFGSVDTDYGSYGTIGQSVTYGTGGNGWGNFISLNGVRSGRYLDPPEFSPLHDVGNNETVFNRADYQPNTNNTLHLNLFFSRAWFQTPNTYDQSAAGQDQRNRIVTYNIAPGWTHIINPNSTLTVNPYIRRDDAHYTPSPNPLDDAPATVGQTRTLTNAGIKIDYSLVKGHHNFKTGVQVQHTFLSEEFSLGITDPNYIAANNTPGLAPYDLTHGGSLFHFAARSDIKEYSYYMQDALTFGGFTMQAGVRFDFYRGLTGGTGAEPRIGASYLFKPTKTVLRASYSNFFETPYNENLLLSSATGSGGLASTVFGAFGAKALKPGTRNQYNVGMQQGFAKYLLLDAGYFWKYTHNAYDFDTLFNSPITFPIQWRLSKIDGVSARATLTPIRGFSAYFILGHTRARFFGPESGGILFNSPLNNNVFRIDHDEALETTANLRYQKTKNGPFASFTWRYDSGEVAGAIPTLDNAFALSGDAQASIGFHCGSTYATISAPVTSCPNATAAANLVIIPKAGTENDDTNPPRVAPRNLFDVSIGDDNIFHTERVRYRAQMTALNITNVVAVYNFLSTFSGTHFISPRAYTLEVGLVW
jgi:outer membrane cobalamin receptor